MRRTLLLRLRLLGPLGLGLGLGGNARASSHVPHVNRQHLAVTDLELLHRLCIVVQKLSIVVYVLRRWGDVGLGLDRSSQGFDYGIGGDIERDKVVVLSSLLVVDGECDTPASGQRLALPVGFMFFVHCQLRNRLCVLSVTRWNGRVREGAG
jgi:hypothetical protein